MLDKKEKQNSLRVEALKDFIKLYTPKFLIGLLIGLILTFIYVISKMIGASLESNNSFIEEFNILYLVDGLFFGGIIVIFIGAFSFMTNKGFFDIFAYNGVRFLNFLKQYKTPNIYGTYEYTESKKSKRDYTKRTFLSYIVSGLIILLTFLICYIVYYL